MKNKRVKKVIKKLIIELARVIISLACILLFIGVLCSLVELCITNRLICISLFIVVLYGTFKGLKGWCNKC